MQKANNNLLELSRFSVHELTKAVKGIGNAKALTLIAALELGNSKRASEALMRDKISSSKDAYEILRCFTGDSSYEQFWIIILNRSNRIITSVLISEGGISGTIADPRRIFKSAIEKNGVAIILSHKHPM